jgi:FAD/FMN-containing dehydrogenase
VLILLIVTSTTNGGSILGRGVLPSAIHAQDTDADAVLPTTSKTSYNILELLHQLDGQLEGSVILRNTNDDNDAEEEVFERAAHVWNQVTQLPLAVVEVATEEDVRKALPLLITFSLPPYQIPFRIRSGGHHYAGWSGMPDGIILSLSHLNKIEGLDQLVVVPTNGTTNATELSSDDASIALWVGPVIRVQDVLQQVHVPHHYSSVIGMCRTVAVGGYALGGGQGLWARNYGLGLDQLVGARLVLANGTMVTTHAAHRPDILWALKGAGQNNFGVVTKLHYRFHPSYDRQVFLSGTIAHDDMPRFFHKLARMEEESLIPGAIGAFVSNGDTVDTYSMIFWYTCFQEQDIPMGEEYLKNNIIPLLVVPSSSKDDNKNGDNDNANVEETSSSTTTANVSVGSWYDLSMTQVPLREGNYVRIWNGFFMKEQNTMEACQDLWDLVRSARELSEYAKVGIELWGGAISDKDPTDTAFYWRQGIYNVHLWLTVPTNLTDENAHERFDRDRLALERIWEQMARQYLTGTYLNYAEASLKDDEYARVTYGGNLERLVELKQELDPSNVFSNPQSIPLKL